MEPTAAVTYKAVAMRLSSVSTPAELERVSHLIQFVPSITERTELSRLYLTRAKQFKPS